MFDIGWSELLVLGALALIVVGPRDLPKLLRSFGQYVGQIRGMARDFQRSMDEAAREADISDMKEMRDAAKSLRDLKRMPFEPIHRPPAGQHGAKPVSGATSSVATGQGRATNGAAARPEPAKSSEDASGAAKPAEAARPEAAGPEPAAPARAGGEKA